MLKNTKTRIAKSTGAKHTGMIQKTCGRSYDQDSFEREERTLGSLERCDVSLLKAE